MYCLFDNKLAIQVEPIPIKGSKIISFSFDEFSIKGNTVIVTNTSGTTVSINDILKKDSEISFG